MREARYAASQRSITVQPLFYIFEPFIVAALADARVDPYLLVFADCAKHLHLNGGKGKKSLSTS